MALSEIEKLERRYAENPQGLTFAPLAEVHRKNGDVPRALDLLRPGLALHPDYIPASIVLGRCHVDLGDLPAAEAAFTHVLALDAENVIALKALADLSERLHHFDQAERWLNTLLSVDRSNDEARAQLERIESARRDAVAAPAPPPTVTDTAPVEVAAEEQPPATSSGTEEPLGAPTGVAAEPPVEHAPPVAPEPVPAWISPAETPADREAAPLTLDDLEPALSADGPEPTPTVLDVDEPEPQATPVEPLAGLIGRDVDEESRDGFQVEISEDIVLSSSGGHEFQVPDASHELSAIVPAPPASPFGDEAAPGFGGFEEAASPPPADPVVPAEPELVVTETMAEVLLQQGHSGEALRVYRELEARNTGDPRLLQKIAELEGAGRPAAPEPIAPDPTPAEPAPARRQYTAAQTGGQSVAEYFGALLAARPPAAAAAAPRAATPPAAAPPERSGAPTRPAADALSLSSVFGEESSPLPPAVPASPAPAAGVSFDEFYSPPTNSGAAAKPRAPDPKSDDLDQFHAWLQNLKR